MEETHKAAAAHSVGVILIADLPECLTGVVVDARERK